MLYTSHGQCGNAVYVCVCVGGGPKLLVAFDVCLCPYTSHGHCGNALCVVCVCWGGGGVPSCW